MLFVVTQYCRLWRLKPEGTANWSWELWREEISGTNMVLPYAAKCKFPCQLSPDAVGGEGTSGTAHEFSGTRLIYSSVTNPGTWPNSSSATKPSAKRHCGDPPALPSLALSLCKPRNGEKKINVSKNSLSSEKMTFNSLPFKDFKWMNKCRCYIKTLTFTMSQNTQPKLLQRASLLR